MFTCHPRQTTSMFLQVSSGICVSQVSSLVPFRYRTGGPLQGIVQAFLCSEIILQFHSGALLNNSAPSLLLSYAHVFEGYFMFCYGLNTTSTLICNQVEWMAFELLIFFSHLQFLLSVIWKTKLQVHPVCALEIAPGRSVRFLGMVVSYLVQTSL